MVTYDHSYEKCDTRTIKVIISPFFVIVKSERGDHKVFLTGILAASMVACHHMAGLSLLQRTEED